jgi:hypothetical protein
VLDDGPSGALDIILASDSRILFLILDSTLEGGQLYLAEGVYKVDRRERLDLLVQAAPIEALVDKLVPK